MHLIVKKVGFLDYWDRFAEHRDAFIEVETQHNREAEPPVNSLPRRAW